MQKYCGVFRTDALLTQGVKEIMVLDERRKHVSFKDKSKVFNTARVEALELDNLIETAKATIVSAQARKESRGAHAHSDLRDARRRQLDEAHPVLLGEQPPRVQGRECRSR